MDNYLHTQEERHSTPDTDNAEDGIQRMWPLLLTAAALVDLLTLYIYGASHQSQKRSACLRARIDWNNNFNIQIL